MIIPIFEKLPLLTSKRYKYDLWLKGMRIWESEIPKEEKVREIKEIKEKMGGVKFDPYDIVGREKEDERGLGAPCIGEINKD